jgi:voltage-gated potassium channel
MLAAAVDQQYLTDYLEDFLTAGGKVNIEERTVDKQDVGKTALDLQPDVLLRVYRQGSILSPWEFQKSHKLEEGDVMLLFKQVSENKASS